MDASLKLAFRICFREGMTYAEYLENTVVLIVPIFNVGGALNRSTYHRANQNGPYGTWIQGQCAEPGSEPRFYQTGFQEHPIAGALSSGSLGSGYFCGYPYLQRGRLSLYPYPDQQPFAAARARSVGLPGGQPLPCPFRGYEEDSLIQ